jgi:hypothetical protein
LLRISETKVDALDKTGFFGEGDIKGAKDSAMLHERFSAGFLPSASFTANGFREIPDSASQRPTKDAEEFPMRETCEARGLAGENKGSR